MSVEISKERERLDVEAFPESIVSVQPGGAIQRLKLCWGSTGSRIELLLQREDFEVPVKHRDVVRGGSTKRGRYQAKVETERDSWNA